MKRILLLSSLLLAFVVSSQAQESRTERALARPNHVMIDPVFLIAGPIVNFSYERALNEDVGLGLHGLIGMETMDDQLQFSPFARFYVAGSHGAGFFLEGFVPIVNREETISEYVELYESNIEATKKHTSVGLGVGVGGKWLLKRNIMLEVSGGLARKLIKSTENTETLTGKWMFGIGYAF